MTRENATPRLLALAKMSRYAGIMSGPTGAALASRFNFDAEALIQAALQGLAESGTDEQRRRSQALASIDEARRVIGLARGGRDAILAPVRGVRPVGVRR